MLKTFIIGWILTLFNIHNIIVDAVNQLFNTDYTTAIYWLFIFIIGIIVRIKDK